MNGVSPGSIVTLETSACTPPAPAPMFPASRTGRGLGWPGSATAVCPEKYCRCTGCDCKEAGNGGWLGCSERGCGFDDCPSTELRLYDLLRPICVNVGGVASVLSYTSIGDIEEYELIVGTLGSE